MAQKIGTNTRFSAMQWRVTGGCIAQNARASG